MDQLDDEILQSFLDESREHLADIENDLLTIEENGAQIDEALVNKVFRAAHSVKGGAGFMGLDTVKNLAHKIENVLGMIRSREIVPTSETINILLRAFDKLREMINNVNESNGQDITEHVVALAGITEAHLPQEEKQQVSQTVEISLPSGLPLFVVSKFDIDHAVKDLKSVLVVEFDLIHDIHRKGLTPLQFLLGLEEKGTIIDCTVEMTTVGTLDEEVIINRLPFYVLLGCDIAPADAAQAFGVKSEEIHALSKDLKVTPVQPQAYDILTPPAAFSRPSAPPPPPPVAQAPMVTESQSYTQEKASNEGASQQPDLPEREASTDEVQAKVTKPSAAKTASAASAATAETTLRVNVKLLDTLMNLAGELVLSRNELVQASTSHEQALVTSATQRINLVTSELQEAIMLTRMQPIGNIFNKFPRVVRDLASALDKKIELAVSGKEVELDKTIIEGLADPLTHLVRNSADHGIETPDVRRKKNKNETGQIWLKAYHEAGQVNIEISDDGKGIDPDKLAELAVAKGLITTKQAQTMSDKEKIWLIFLPGFSTASKVSDVSGRGVGMDVVKTNLDRLGGQIEVDTKVGKGTTIRIKLPLTLAIIPSLMISSNGHRYAMPMVNVVELLRIPAKQIVERIEKVGEAEVVRLRQELLPILSLRKILAEEDLTKSKDLRSEREEAMVTNKAMSIVVVATGNSKYGLIVDELHDSEEIVVKPLGQQLKHCKGYAGATIMGNGHVALILDVASMARMARLNVEDIARAAVDTAAATEKAASQSLLVFGSSEHEKFGVPVDLVGRIERIKAADVEHSGGKKTIKYRGGILQVYALDEVARVDPLAQRDELLVIVFSLHGHEFGLLAISPIDTVDVAIALDTETLRQTGIKGSAIIEGKTTLIVDINEYIATLKPEWKQITPEKDVEEVQTGSKILYAEDSGFFRNTVKMLLEEEGYQVIAAPDGLEAWRLLEENAADVSVVVTDIEMPNLDGLGLTKMIRADKRFQSIPIIALTTLAGEKDIEKGKAMGVTEYQVKLDKERLLASVHGFLDRN